MTPVEEVDPTMKILSDLVIGTKISLPTNQGTYLFNTY